MVGQLVAHYRILSEIGSGGMGSVFLARDERTGNEVALKVLLREHAADPDMRSRFLHEARAQAMISHPNVAAFHEVGEDSGQVFIAMEYIPGPTLAEYVSKNELRPTDAIALGIQLAHGLHAAHSKGVIHRDLKPANIMLTADGQPKIMDFGLARFKGATTITKTGRIIGTARYMSPEQAEGRRVDHRSDLFSLGIILYELICRRAPFDGENDTAVLYELLTKTPHPVARYASHVPVELEQVIAKALAKDPVNRYQSAEEFITDLNAVRRRLETGDAIRIKDTIGARKRRRRWIISSAVAVASILAALTMRSLFQKQVRENEVMGLAVLPLDNIGSPGREYFTDGVTDELTTRLSALEGLRVISRTSARQYKDSTKSISEIARALNVDLVIEGTVRWDSSDSGLRMRITPRLIRARDEQALWTQTYDRSFAEVLLTQAEIAEAVTAQISGQLGRTLKLPVQAIPTSSVDAFNYYLRGSEYLNRGFDRPDLEIAITQFGQAITLDSNFAAAHARLSRAHSKYYWFHGEADSVRIALARHAAETALRLSPNLPEAHLALGYCLYWGDRDFERALEQFQQVRNLEPSNADAHFAIGGIFRRLGRFDEAATSFTRAMELDALSSNRAFEVGNTYFHMRRCAEADSFFNRAISLAPDQFAAYSRKTVNRAYCEGRTDGARAFIDSSIQRIGAQRFSILLFELDRLDGRFDSALTRLSLSATDSAHYYASIAKVYRMMNQTASADAAYDSARALLEQRLASDSSNPSVMSSLGLVYAALGRGAEGVLLAEQAVRLRPIAGDAFGGPYFVEQLAEVYLLAGRYDEAITQLELLLSIPCAVSPRTLQLDNTWNPLRTHERFMRLVSTP